MLNWNCSNRSSIKCLRLYHISAVDISPLWLLVVASHIVLCDFQLSRHTPLLLLTSIIQMASTSFSPASLYHIPYSLLEGDWPVLDRADVSSIVFKKIQSDANGFSISTHIEHLSLGKFSFYRPCCSYKESFSRHILDLHWPLGATPCLEGNQSEGRAKALQWFCESRSFLNRKSRHNYRTGWRVVGYEKERPWSYIYFLILPSSFTTIFDSWQAYRPDYSWFSSDSCCQAVL